MYSVGDIVVYGNKGVYRIDEIGLPQMDWLKPQREYYTLIPLFDGERIYTPIDTPVFMRKIMTKAEAIDFIMSMPDILVDENECKNPRSMESYYKTALESHSLDKVTMVIKRIYAKKLAARDKGKKLAQIDEKYLKQAEGILYRELAAVFDIQSEAVTDFICDTIDGKTV